MTSTIIAHIKQSLFILLTASVLFVGGWIHTAAAERLTIAENLVSELLTELESIEANASTLSPEARKERLTNIMNTILMWRGLPALPPDGTGVPPLQNNVKPIVRYLAGSCYPKQVIGSTRF